MVDIKDSSRIEIPGLIRYVDIARKDMMEIIPYYDLPLSWQQRSICLSEIIDYFSWSQKLISRRISDIAILGYNTIFVEKIHIRDIWNWCDEQFGENLHRIGNYKHASWFPVYLNTSKTKMFYVFKTDAMSVEFAIRWGGQHV